MSLNKLPIRGIAKSVARETYQQLPENEWEYSRTDWYRYILICLMIEKDPKSNATFLESLYANLEFLGLLPKEAKDVKPEAAREVAAEYFAQWVLAMVASSRTFYNPRLWDETLRTAKRVRKQPRRVSVIVAQYLATHQLEERGQ